MLMLPQTNYMYDLYYALNNHAKAFGLETEFIQNKRLIITIL